MKSIFLILVIIFLATFNSFAQWQAVQNPTSSNTYGLDIVVDNVGNIYSAGFCFVNSTEKENYFIAKYNPNGDTIWTLIYDRANGSDKISAIIADAENNIIVVGTSYTSVNGEDILAHKYSPDGVLLNTYIFDGTSHLDDKAIDILEDSDGNYYICGISRLTSQRAIVLIKTNSNLERIWTKISTAYYGADSKAMSYNETNQTIAIAGFNTDWENDYLINTVVYDSAGTKLWDKYFQNNADKNAVGFDVLLADDSSVFTCGYESDVNTNVWEALLIKYNTVGDTVWTRKIESEDVISIFKSMAFDNSGNIVITGISGQNAITSKYSQDGQLLWTKSLASISSFSTFDTRNSILNNANDDVFVLARGSVASGNGVMLSKYSSDGDLDWTVLKNYSQNSNDEPLTFDIDNSGNSYVISNARNASYYYDMVTTKISANNNAVTIFSKENNLEVYPNPCEFSFSINVNTEKNSKLEIFNTFGGLEKSVYLNSDNQKINVETLANGVYFVVVTNDEGSTYSKISIIK